MHYAERINRLGTETAFEVLSRIQNFSVSRKKNVISFAIGEPDFDTPKHIKQAGIKAIKNNFTHYSVSAGLPELRKGIAEFINENRGMNITSKNVVILPSAKFTVDLALLSCTNPGDEVTISPISI